MVYIILALIAAIIKLWWDLRGLDARLKIHESLIDMAVVDIEKMIELDKLTTKMVENKPKRPVGRPKGSLKKF